MSAITFTDLSNAKIDVDHIAELATSPGLTATDRLGNVKFTVAGALAEFPNAAAHDAAAALSAAAALNSSISAEISNDQSALAKNQAVSAWGGAITAKNSAQAASDAAIAAAVGISGSIIGKATKALLDADLAHADGAIALVTNDATAANNGNYRKSGSSGSGSWIQSSYDRVAVVESRTLGIGATFDKFTGDGATTTCFLKKANTDDILTRTDWQGVNQLLPTARRNKLSKSNEFNTWNVAAGVSITPNASLAPDGTMTASLVDWSAAAPSAGFYRYTDDVAVIGETDYHYVWLKSFSGTMTINFIDAGSGTGGNISVGPTWQQYSLAVLHSVIQQGPWFRRDPGSEKFYIAFAETKTGPSPYIPTTTTAVTVTDYVAESNNKVTLAVAPKVGDVIKWTPASPDSYSAQEIGDTIFSATEKVTLENADLLPIADSSAGNILKKVSWTNYKVNLTSYLNGQYIKLNQSGILSSDIFQIKDSSTRVIVGTNTGSGGTGINQTALGYGVFVANTSGYDNVAVGTLAMRFNTSGSGCVAIGNQAGYANTTSFYLTAVGDACFRDSTGERNTGLGAYAGRNTTTGHDNLYLGWYAGSQQVTLDNALIIDNRHRASAAEEITNSLVIGHFDNTPAAQWLRVNADLLMGAGAKLKNVAQPTGTPAAASDLATAITLLNSLRASLLALGLVA